MGPSYHTIRHCSTLTFRPKIPHYKALFYADMQRTPTELMDVKFILEQATEAQRGSRGITLLFL
jgi:hypothetical protein